jgi:hypothetical protein
MANAIDLTTIFLAKMDEAYKDESKSAVLDALQVDAPEFNGTANIKIMKLTTTGLGNYSRATGSPDGDFTATWELLTLATERARKFSIDAMDNDESLGLVLGNAIRTFQRISVAPELDAYRFAKYASWSGISTVAAATLSASTVLAAFDAAMLQQDEDEVPMDGRKLFASATVASFLKQSLTRLIGNNEGNVDRTVQNLDRVQIVPVPQTRFYTKITLDPGASSSAGGFSKNTGGGGVDINFLLIHPSAVIQAKKLDNVRYFSADINQTKNAHLWDYRLYHDAFVEDNKVKGVYLHKKAT